MRIKKDDLPVTIAIPGATVRQVHGFGRADGYGEMAGEYLSLAAGTDISPLLEGLPADTCHAPHWGFLLEGEVTVTYVDGSTDTIEGGELFYWPPGHTVRVGADAEIILFSPALEHDDVLRHMKGKLGVDA